MKRHQQKHKMDEYEKKESVKLPATTRFNGNCCRSFKFISMQLKDCFEKLAQIRGVVFTREC